jgi:hypothetical protein
MSEMLYLTNTPRLAISCERTMDERNSRREVEIIVDDGDEHGVVDLEIWEGSGRASTGNETASGLVARLGRGRRGVA